MASQRHKTRKSSRLHWQIFKHDVSRYERPSQKWVCGNKASGCPCHIGPDEKGNCRATHECTPVRSGDSWQCTRSKQMGGKCEQGPLPDGTCCRAIEKCIPVPSHRATRANLVYMAIFLTIAVLLFFVSGPMRSDFISPGAAGNFHGSIAGDCKQCHSADSQSGAGLLTTAFHPSDGITESHKCLDCHDLGKNALMTHSLPAKVLAAQSSQMTSKPSLLQQVGFHEPKDAKGEIACAACHQEHRGKGFDIKAVQNMQCQSCHKHTFKSLADGHPEFKNYPYKQRLNLKFDHVSHIKKHFDEAEQSVSCIDCHKTDQRGKMMVIKSYKEVCGSCHTGQIRGEERSGEKGVRVFTIPGVDVLTLKQKHINIGYWPEDADGEITPFMKLLLSTDDDYKDISSTLEDVDLLDLQDADQEALDAVQRLVWAVKKLYVNIALKGQAEIKERLEAILDRELTPDELASLSAMIPAAMMDSALRNWIPTAYAEMQQREDEENKAPINRPKVNDKVAEFLLDNMAENGERSSGGGWYRGDDSFSIYYRPTGHADQFMQAWLNNTVSAESDSAKAVFTLLSDKEAPGVCMKCHSISEKNGKLKMNWMSHRPQPFERRRVDFRHSAHFSLTSKDGCATCHKLDLKADFMSAYDDNKVVNFSSSFTDIKRNTCLTCHTPSRAGDSCLGCHNYHIGVFEPTKNSHPVKEKIARRSDTDSPAQ